MIGAGPIRRGWTGYELVRVALGLLLLVAAGLKAHDLLTAPPVGEGLFTNRWLLIGLVDFELLFGLWLLGGFYPRATRLAAVLLFAGFALVSLGKAVSGAASCGCFGRVEVNPWVTFALDVTAALALAYVGPPARLRDGLPNAPRRVRLAVVAGGSVILGAVMAATLGGSAPAALSDAGEILGDGSVVVLEPQKWVGKRFPLLQYIDIGPELAEGEWIVVLYRAGCGKCRRLLADDEALAGLYSDDGLPPMVAFVRLPDYTGEPIAPGRDHVLGKLSDEKEWLVAVPVRILLRDGLVVRCRT